MNHRFGDDDEKTMEGMDVSPMPPPPVQRASSTPSSHLAKRMREGTDFMDELVESVLPKRSSHPASRVPLGSNEVTPPRSPDRAAPARGAGGGAPGSAMCTTPLAGFATDSASLAAGMGVRWGVQQRQGPRSTQEDCVVCKVDDRSFAHGFYGVFDGHGGALASEYAAQRLHQHVLDSAHFPTDVLSALQDGFLRTDAELLRRAAAPPRRKDDDCGAAAVACLVTHDSLAIAHAGDCRAILVKRSGQALSFVALTHDHTADRIPTADGHDLGEQYVRPDEVMRVQRVGGHMDSGGYVRATANAPPNPPSRSTPPATAAAAWPRAARRAGGMAARAGGGRLRVVRAPALTRVCPCGADGRCGGCVCACAGVRR